MSEETTYVPDIQITGMVVHVEVRDKDFGDGVVEVRLPPKITSEAADTLIWGEVLAFRRQKLHESRVKAKKNLVKGASAIRHMRQKADPEGALKREAGRLLRAEKKKTKAKR